MCRCFFVAENEKEGEVVAKLTDKQKKFVNEYLIDLNATQAAIRAGYSEKTARSIGQRLLTNVDIQSDIQKRQTALQEKTEITQERVLRELSKIGFASLTDYLSYKTAMRQVDTDSNGEPVYDWAMIVDAMESEQVDGAPIQEVSIGRDGTFKFKLYSKLDALDKIARHLGMYSEQKEDEGESVVIVDDFKLK